MLYACQLETKGRGADEAGAGGSVSSGGALGTTLGGESSVGGSQVLDSGSFSSTGGLTSTDPANGGTASGGSSPSTTESLTGGSVGTGGISNVSSGTGGTTENGTTEPGGNAGTGGTTDTGTSSTGGVSSTGGSSSTGGTSSTGGDPTGCTMGASPCTSIPQFTGNQVVDGLGTEFCSYPGFELSFGNAAKVLEYNGNFGAESYTERAIVRVTWSGHHLRAFIRVYDKEIVPASSFDEIWNADGIELMITSDTSVTGSTAVDASALRVIVSPGVGNAKGFGAVAKTTGTTATHAALPANEFATVQDAEGYSVELNLTFTPNNATVSSGDRVYFDFALNAADANTGNNPRDAQAIYYLGTAPSTSPCGSDVLPYCDDRVWCQTTFQ